MKNEIVFGIDPGFDRLGWSVAQFVNNKCNLLSYGLITTNKKDTLCQRYLDLANQFEVLVQEFKPTQAALESLFFQNNQKTAIAVAQARGIILSALLRSGATCYEYTPPQIKLAVAGHGKADKKSVEKMVRAQIALPDEKIIDDTIDSLAVLLTHFANRKNNV
ncbi:MAG: crossover junction endodeoxyribonuclease RuvC [Pseudomonadales bacterium]|jgi:crossover junction endodeoxyribonuclease RuvC|nr:crossover junction endodeoxyribonuclease RuvC [Pseudomonadales bacterium]